MNGLRALAFDIQGTAVDFYTPLMRMGVAMNAAKGLDLDWERLARDWRGLYRETMDAIIAGRRPWLRVDHIYREALDTLLLREDIAARFSERERDEINAVWSHLDPWPDSIAGLTRLRRHYTLATLSNAGMTALIAVVKHAALPFDTVLSAELAQSYKPAPAVYQLAVDHLDLPAEAIMMVACHTYDLEAAQTFGLRTAFVARPLEFGPHERGEFAPDPRFDINAHDFLDLADQLGA